MGVMNDIDKAIKNKHMTFSQAATLAVRGNVKELILIHFGVAMENPEAFLGLRGKFLKIHMLLKIE